jgi:predicted nucleic-acid-binding Zn-ribbon protein
MKQRNECIEKCGGKISKLKQVGMPRSRLKNNFKIEHK